MAKLSLITFILLLSIVSRVNSQEQAPDDCVQVVSVQTGNIKDAGTAAKVRLALYDSSDSTTPFATVVDLGNYRIDYFVFGSSSHFFRANDTETFTFSTECRKACKIVLSHDNTNVSPDWFVNNLNITFVQSSGSVPLADSLGTLPAAGSVGHCFFREFNFNEVKDDSGEGGAWLANDTTSRTMVNC